ncbi:WD repeat-containing protein RUP2-like isoform X2 [Ipomoea triloba]|uniref:WD repeat-containing protein RUP2-like isoform X2 n=1 Tax=Ipomoea triloba TaxID=35885 RepID=UPI00125E33FC|nr:WD repeat-containing protein RUP2-like isoform X2 [Ipomoea triloba]
MNNFSSPTNAETSQTTQQEEDVDGERARCEWDFRISAVVSSPTSAAGAVSDALGVLEFDPSDNFLATGGIARKIRVYSVNSLVPIRDQDEGYDAVSLDHSTACDYYICTPAKLSSLKWKPGWNSRVLGSGDYDGVVMEYDLERRVPVFERDEHGGRRVWSVDYSHSDPVVGASGSDDGTMQTWDPRCQNGKCLATVQPSKARSSVCCVQFSPFAPSIAAGCADRKTYTYDLRKTAEPLFILDGHLKPVTYARFLDHRTILTSSIDGCIKMWDTDHRNLVRTYKGHINSTRFVGLSVWKKGGLISCGSENNQVFVYDTRWGEPIWVYGCKSTGQPGPEHGFISCVCWMQRGDDHCTLVAGGSDGVLRVFAGKRRKAAVTYNLA